MSESAAGTKDFEELNTSPAIDEKRTDPADEGRRNASILHVEQYYYVVDPVYSTIINNI